MEVVTGALPSVITKLGELLVGEYKLQKGVKGEIRFLQSELESMKGALEKLSNTPIDELDIQDKIWARELRELSYDIEDNIDIFMICGKGNEAAQLRGIKKFIDRSVGLFRKVKVRHGIATEIRDIKIRVEEVAKRNDRYKIIRTDAAKPVTIDPRLLTQYTEVRDLVGIDEARDELIKTLEKENQVSMQQHGKIVSIVGFGGLGKTTIANVVYEKIRAQFDCCAFVSVSQTPDLKKLFMALLNNLGKNTNEETLDVEHLIRVLREFLHQKRYFVVIDDIWDISVWKIIRCALPDNDVGYTIITTTRKSDVAKLAGVTYKLRPLSLNNPRKLLYRRIFGNKYKENSEEAKCPDLELAEVSDKILNKCAGVPLAVITMASLLACKARNKMDWYEVYNSIGTGLENNLDVDNMRKILAFSYYELPCHLRTCLLYLSIFPEDFVIDKDQLIRMWAGEGFIQCEKPGKSLFELGESYFNELVNRSMIQPLENQYGMTYGCRVHDMVLDLICSLSSEENFVNVLNKMDQASPPNTVRRLSLQNGKESHVKAQATWSLQHARSLIIFPSIVAQVPAPDSCRVLRVLELKGCNLSKANSLQGLGNLYHLRYLGLGATRLSQLPNEIGNLQFLQTLNVQNNHISNLPSSVVQLRNLMCLCIDMTTRVPNGIGNLSCLERLSYIVIDDCTVNIIEELGRLTELRLLRIQLKGEWNEKLLVESLRKLQKIKELRILGNSNQCNIGGLDTWVAPRHLHVLRTRTCCWFSTLPSWLNPSLLVDLTSLDIAVRELHQVDLEVLGRLSALRYLNLKVDNKNIDILHGFIVAAGSFPCLVVCLLRGFLWPIVFEQGAMLRLRQLCFNPFHVLDARGIASSDGGLDLGLENLPSLQRVNAFLQSEGASKEAAEKAEAALRHAAEMHPNHPGHDISITPIYEDSSLESHNADSDQESTEEERTGENILS